MYSGITRGCFPVVEVEPKAGATRFSVELSAELSRGIEIGASIAVDGVCLTAAALKGTRVTFDAVAETLSRSTLDTLQVGRKVSVERSVRVGDELGGHDVFGHVMGTGKVLAVERRGEELMLRIGVPATWMKYILHKGFIALDGSSLTVGEVHAHEGRFEVHLVPETQRITGFVDKRVGDRVNVELDPRTVAIVDTVERVLHERGHK